MRKYYYLKHTSIQVRQNKDLLLVIIPFIFLLFKLQVNDKLYRFL
jgi:hypothetical protein